MQPMQKTTRLISNVIRLKQMKIDIEKPEPFDWICLVLFVLLLTLSIYFFSTSNSFLAILSFSLSIWALLTFLMRVVIGSAYLEGHIVRLLIKNGGNMPINVIQKYYRRYGSIDFVVDRLENRNAIEIVDGTIELKAENITTGYKNRLMMWGTRRVKL
jgi:hypothetical protein